MKKKKTALVLNRAGVDLASETIQSWLSEGGIKHKDIVRIRLTIENVLETVCAHNADAPQAELSYRKGVGASWLNIRYGGERIDPTQQQNDEVGELSASVLEHTGFLPTWRWRNGKNELRLRIPGTGLRPEFVMLGSIALAVIIGLMGGMIPETVRTGITEYVLRYLSGGFLNLLNTFIGLMIFLVIVMGISGIGSVSAFEKIGKYMTLRFVVTSFIITAVVTFASRFFFSITGGGAAGGSQGKTILDMVFNIVPSNPVKPFLEGNNLQIVFIGIIVGGALLAVGSAGDGLRKVLSQAQDVIRLCVSAVCMLLPLYIFSSLVIQIWANGAGIFARLWRPIVFAAVLGVFFTGVYVLIVCKKLRVRPGILLSKLMPPFLITLATASTSAALPATFECNEEKLGIEQSFSRTSTTIGILMYAGTGSMLIMLSALYVAEVYGVNANLAWWVILWISGTLLTMAIPPVAGGGISCLSILILQLQIPQEGLAIGVTLLMFLDFICTSSRMITMQLETILQADHLDLLDREKLREKS